MASIAAKLAERYKSGAAEKVAESAEEEGKKEGIWSSIKALLKPAAGIVSKGALTALGVTNPYLIPLLTGLGTAGITKIVDLVGRKQGAGADPSEIVSESKFEFGKEEAETISKRLEESIEEKDPLSKESLLSDIASSYLSALTPKIDPKTGEVTGGDLGKKMKKDIGRMFHPKVEDVELSSIAEKFAEDPLLALEQLKVGEDIQIPDVIGRPEDIDYSNLISEDVLTGVEVPPAMEFPPSRPDVPIELEESFDMPWEKGSPDPRFSEFGKYGAMEESLQEQEMFSDWQSPSARPPSDSPFKYSGSESLEGIFPDTSDIKAPTGMDVLKSALEKEKERQAVIMKKRSARFGFKQGGQVPKYRGGGTIADYFGTKGMTLGGSNKQSLSEMLGKK